MKRKSVALIVTLSMMLSIVGCGSKADDAPNESQVVVESSTVESTAESMVEPEAVVETEPTGTVETTETTEEVAVSESKLKVEIVGNFKDESMGQNIVIASVTNVSDETYAFFPSGMVTCTGDAVFEPDEIAYVYGYTEANEDEITNELEKNGLMERVNNGNTVTHMDTFTAEQFADAIALAERFESSNCEVLPYAILQFNGDTLLGMDNNIWVDETTHELRLMYEEADKIIVLWYETTE